MARERREPERPIIGWTNGKWSRPIYGEPPTVMVTRSMAAAEKEAEAEFYDPGIPSQTNQATTSYLLPGGQLAHDEMASPRIGTTKVTGLPIAQELARGGRPIDFIRPPDGTYFWLFNKLPLEIRLKIWGMTGPGQTIITQAKPLGYKPLYTVMNPRPTPAVLHVCRESRNEFLYRDSNEVANGKRKDHPLYAQCFPNTEGKMVYFSFEVDALFLTSFKLAERSIAKDIRYMIMNPHIRRAPRISFLPFHPYSRRRFKFEYDIRDLKRFPNLEELTILINRLDSNEGMEACAKVEREFEKMMIRDPRFKAPILNFQESGQLGRQIVWGR